MTCRLYLAAGSRLLWGPMSGARQDSGGELQGWLLTSVCPPARTRAGLFVAVVLSVMAGLLAMHALSSGHSGHAAAAAGHQHAQGHSHTGDHHESAGQVGSGVVAAEASGGPALAAGAAADVPMASLVSAVRDTAMAGPGKDQGERVGHGLCLARDLGIARLCHR